MPRKRRASKRKRTELTWAQLSELILGPGENIEYSSRVLGPYYPNRSAFDSEEQAREVWLEHREQFEQYCPGSCPGHRPWGWWQFEAPEPRRILGWVQDEPSVISADGTLGGRSPVLEDEEEYLRRLGLLRPDEEQALAEERERRREIDRTQGRRTEEPTAKESDHG